MCKVEKINFFLDDKPIGEVTNNLDYAIIPVPSTAGGKMLKITFAVPIIDMQGYWVPESRTPSSKIIWVIESQSAGQRAFPFLSFFNGKGVNRLSCGTTNLADDCKISARMNQEMCVYNVTFEICVSDKTSPFNLILDSKDYQWTTALKSWREELNIPLKKYPEGAWNPVYCTWYAVHAAVLQDWVEANAKIASDMGFKTLIIDDGWCFDVMKRVSPQTITSWYEYVGDWEVSKKKFPDFDGHRDRVKQMGMDYLLWVAPFLIGAKSKLYADYPDAVEPKYHEGCYTLDINHDKVAKIIMEKMKKVMIDNKLDGLKIDFLDYIFPNITNPHGQEVTKFIENLTNAVKEAKSDALIEFRQAYATPSMQNYGTQFRAGDVPFDFIDNFHRLVQIRISMGDNIPVHADPVYWGSKELPENIARHMIASLVGVPMLSMDLLEISEMEKKIISFWVDFYNQHRPVLNYGKWDACYRLSGCAYAIAQNEEEAIIIIQDAARLNQAIKEANGKKTYVLNLAPEVLEANFNSIYSYDGTALNTAAVPVGGMGVIG